VINEGKDQVRLLQIRRGFIGKGDVSVFKRDGWMSYHIQSAQIYKDEFAAEIVFGY
jgi:hypothetical protein